MRATQALLSLLAKYATFLRYCIVGVLASGVFYCVANLSALLLKVDSMDSYSASAECMDCHAANAARNDKNNPTSKKVDSNAFTQNIQNLETPQAASRQLQNVSKLAQDSRICDEKCGLQGKSQGSYLDGNDRRDFSPLPHLSRKAESSKKAQHSQTATLLGSLASFIFGYFAQMRLAFRAYPNHSTMLPRYLALLALIAIYAQAITYLGAFFTLPYYLISAFIALSVPLFSYPLQKLWVFASPVKTSNGGGRLSKDSAFGLESWISSPRFVDRPQVLSSLHGLKSHDSISKILESKSGSESHKSTASRFKLESTFSLSSRASETSVAIHTSSLESTLTKLDSSISAFLNLIYFTQAHFLAVFFSPFLWLVGLTPRSFMRPLLLAPCGAIEKIDCHADFQSARNDRNNATFQSIASLEKADSRSKAQPAHHDSKHCGGALHSMPKPKTPQATGFCDDFGGFQAVGAGIYLVGNEQAHRAESTKSAQKPNPPKTLNPISKESL